jgi:hypothetical protein
MKAMENHRQTSVIRNVIVVVLVIAIAAWIVANPVQTGHLLRDLANFVMFLINRIVLIIESAV